MLSLAASRPQRSANPSCRCKQPGSSAGYQTHLGSHREEVRPYQRYDCRLIFRNVKPVQVLLGIDRRTTPPNCGAGRRCWMARSCAWTAKWKFAPYLPDRPASWLKIRNRSYSQWVGREELFERERAVIRIFMDGIRARGRVLRSEMFPLSDRRCQSVQPVLNRSPQYS